MSTCINSPRAPVTTNGTNTKSSPPDIVPTNLDVTEYSDDGKKESGPKSRSYAARYTSPENEKLAQSWVNISEDATIGNAQKLDAMWKRIAEDYEKTRPIEYPVRRWDHLKTHFYTVQRFVSAFNGLYTQIEKDWGSEQSDADILMHAMKEWTLTHNNHAFSHLGMWKILKECPKWIAQQERDHCGRKKKQTVTEGGDSSSNVADIDEERIRPIGQKAAKRKAKEKVSYHSKDNMLEELKQSIQKNMQEYKEIANAKLKEQQRHNKKWEYEIIMKDTTGMTPKQLAIHQKLVDDIEKKWEAEFD